MKVLEGRRIGVVGRGGAGKSTVVVMLATRLREQGHAVCVLDVDSTNLGLQRALGIADPPEPLINYFGGMVFQGGSVSCPVDDPTLIQGGEINLDEIDPSYLGRSPGGVVLVQAGKLAEFGVGAGCDGPMVKIARDLRVRQGATRPVLIIDFKAGLEDLSRGALVGMDDVIAVCDPSLAGISAAITLQESIGAQRAGGEPAVRHLESAACAELARRLYRESRLGRPHVVINRVSDDAMEKEIRERLEGRRIEVASVIPDLPEVRNAWLRGTALPSGGALNAIAKLVERLEMGAEN